MHMNWDLFSYRPFYTTNDTNILAWTRAGPFKNLNVEGINLELGGCEDVK